VKVNLPYTVTLGDKTLPPGEYTIQQLENAGGDSPVLLIYNGSGMKFQTSAMTVKAVDVTAPSDSSVSLHHIGDNYYFDKVWVAGKNYGYEIPLPKSVKEREAEASSAAVSVPAQIGTTSDTTASSSSDTSTTTTTTTATDNTPPTTATDSTPPPPPEPTPVPEPAASTPPPPQPQASADTDALQQATPPPPPDQDSANREKRPDDAPSMPATSAGWLAMLLTGGTLSGAGMMLRRRQR